MKINFKHDKINNMTTKEIKEINDSFKSKKGVDCCLCGDKIKIEDSGWSLGHNAEPLATGRCCDFCNSTKVLPKRFKMLHDGERW